MNFDVIYELVQGVRKIIERKIVPEKMKIDLGKLKVLAIFRTEKNRQIVGGKAVEGKIKKGAFLEIFRDERKIGKGKIIELQRDKKNVEEVAKGAECGILFQGDVKIEEGDILNVYTEEMKKADI